GSVGHTFWFPLPIELVSAGISQLDFCRRASPIFFHSIPSIGIWINHFRRSCPPQTTRIGKPSFPFCNFRLPPDETRSNDNSLYVESDAIREIRAQTLRRPCRGNDRLRPTQ